MSVVSLFEKKELDVNIDGLKEEKEILKTLSTYTSISNYDDMTWVCDIKNKKKNTNIGNKSIYFNGIEDKYIKQVKLSALLLLNQNKSISYISGIVSSVKLFLDFYKKYPDKDFNDITKGIMFEYQQFLECRNVELNTNIKRWGELRKFFYLLNPFGYTPPQYIMKKTYANQKSINVNKKYIPKYILLQLDDVMKKNEIPLHFRAVYWICRLIPNRITEVCSMNLDNCIRPYNDNEKVITIPTFKQNGGYVEPEDKMILIKEEGIAKYLIELIEEQKEVSIKLQDSLDEDNKGFLFAYHPTKYNPHKKCYGNPYGNPTLLNDDIFYNFLNNISKRYNIKDDNGKIYNVTSHQFRHVGITDRLYEGFRVIDLMSMTRHKNGNMIQENYHHIDTKKLKEKAIEVKGEEKQEVFFRGRILNSTDEKRWEMVLKKPFAHSIGRLGVCSDNSDCECDMYECLNDCQYFAINADNLPYFKEELASWEKKVLLYTKMKKDCARENAEYNVKLFKKQIDLIESTLKENNIND